MSEENQDKSQKTEQPTEHRLEEARKKGQIPLSREVNHWVSLLAMSIIIAFLLPYCLERLALVLRPLLEFSSILATDGAGLLAVSKHTLIQVALVLGLPALLLIAAALAGAGLQTRFRASLESIKPKLDKLSPLKGIERLFSRKAFAEFFKSVLKVFIVGGVAFYALYPEFQNIRKVSALSLNQLLALLHDNATKLVIAVLAIMTVIALIDILYQRFEHIKKLMMSKQEIKDEHKQLEGDPKIKQKLKQIRQEKSRQRMMAAVPEATVIVTNPTHYSIALKYEKEMLAPIVIAKGADHLALRMREVAKEHDIAVIESPPLARSLYDTVEVDQEIKYEHYEVVAKIIRHVMDLKGRVA
ncbi:MAG: flagellar biosynthesis protein FlhB [bacterium]|nr:flagellar biosynthesis protein FlhB [bacterium]